MKALGLLPPKTSGAFGAGFPRLLLLQVDVAIGSVEFFFAAEPAVDTGTTREDAVFFFKKGITAVGVLLSVQVRGLKLGNASSKVGRYDLVTPQVLLNVANLALGRFALLF